VTVDRTGNTEKTLGAPKGEGDEPPARPEREKTPQVISGNVVRPAEFQRRSATTRGVEPGAGA
jgi:hypothetical protein